MAENNLSEAELLCPSAQPEMENATVLGVFEGTEKDRRLSYANESIRVTRELLDSVDGVPATLVYRFAAKCLGNNCVQYGSGHCRLGKQLSNALRTTTDKIPPCTIRSNCRWYNENGTAACLRCSQVVTRMEIGEKAKNTDTNSTE